jgi:hypothetical protein
VKDPLNDYLVMADSDFDFAADEVENRNSCFEYCSRNRIAEGGTCCGLVFENEVESGTNKINCGLFFSDIVDREVAQFEGGFYYYTAIEMGEGLIAKFEDINALISDTTDDWLRDSANRVAMACASVFILVAYI